jgi:dihydrodipicolinate synthase/N-acetylneuraminate lyase
MGSGLDPRIKAAVRAGLVIPACPLALTAQRRLDERRERALVRYYLAAGAGGLAVGVHTTQFAIRDPKHALLEPILRLTAEELDRADARARGNTPAVRIAGVCGPTAQASTEAELARDCGFHAGLLSLAALRNSSEDELIAHCRELAGIIPLVGFYLQPAVGGRVLPFSFWRRFAEIDTVIAVKIAPFDRYRTLDVVRAVIESRRDDLALYSGNDDNIVIDLITPFVFARGREGEPVIERRIVGGLLGHWAIWTRRAVELLQECHGLAASGADIPANLLRQQVEVTDANAAVFDAANGFAGCIAGIHEVLRRQGLLDGIWCLDPAETLGPGQAQEIDRVCCAYPHLQDDSFVRENLDDWLRG